MINTIVLSIVNIITQFFPAVERYPWCILCYAGTITFLLGLVFLSCVMRVKKLEKKHT